MSIEKLKLNYSSNGSNCDVLGYTQDQKTLCCDHVLTLIPVQMQRPEECH